MENEMETWAFYAADAVEQAAQHDAGFQQLSRARMELAPQYEAFLATLTPQQRELLVSYQCCMEDLEYQRTRVAYFLGRRDQTPL